MSWTSTFVRPRGVLGLAAAGILLLLITNIYYTFKVHAIYNRAVDVVVSATYKKALFCNFAIFIFFLFIAGVAVFLPQIRKDEAAKKEFWSKKTGVRVKDLNVDGLFKLIGFISFCIALFLTSNNLQGITKLTGGQ